MLNLINFQIEPPPLPRRQHSQIEHLILCRECDCDCSKQQEQYNSTSSLFFSFCLQYDQVYSKTLNTWTNINISKYEITAQGQVVQKTHEIVSLHLYTDVKCKHGNTCNEQMNINDNEML